jgi:hypothetical protein
MSGADLISQPSVTTAVTSASVTPTLGYPNHRLETSESPVGWQVLNNVEITNVSRETYLGDAG